MLKSKLKQIRVINKIYSYMYNIYKNIRYKYLMLIPEKKYPSILARIYRKRTGYILDWDNLKSYTEKMQWSKLYDNPEIKGKLTDKYIVREWVKEKIGEKYLIPLLGVWNQFDEINFDDLPDEFVLKTNNASGTNLIVKNKKELDLKKTKKKFDKWINIKYAYYNAFELHYNMIEPKIIAEKYISGVDNDLFDYKFLCFDGKAHYCWVDQGRFSDHRRNVYDLNWELQEWQQHVYDNTNEIVNKPDQFDLMVSLAEKLAEGFSHVRVDFYNVNGRIYFGEMTFTNGNGFELIKPNKYNLMLGELWKLPTDNNVGTD